MEPLIKVGGGDCSGLKRPLGGGSTGLERDVGGSDILIGAHRPPHPTFFL